MEKNTDKMTSLAGLLPEGLSESAITEIASLVDTIINEQVEEKARQLEAKVKGFMRLKIDELKEQAVKELQEDTEFVRNANLFESVKTLMAVELNKHDEESAISELVSEQEQSLVELEVLTEELQKAFDENEKLVSQLKAVSTKVAKLEEEKTFLAESIVELDEAKEKPFKSSERAVIIAEDVDKTPEKSSVFKNDFLTPEVMKFMPSN